MNKLRSIKVIIHLRGKEQIKRARVKLFNPKLQQRKKSFKKSRILIGESGVSSMSINMI